MQYFLRYLFFVLCLFSCAPTISEEVVEVSVGNFFYDVSSDEVIIEGSISASNLFSVEGSKVSIDNIEVNDYGHYIFVEIDNTDPNEAEFSTINPGPSQQNFLSVIPGLNPDVQYYARVYAVPENSGAPLLSDPEPFVVSNANNVKRVNFWDPDPIIFEGETRTAPISFGIGNQAFIGTGFQNSEVGENINLKDLWRYDTDSESWSLVNSVADDFEERSNAVAVTIGNSVYLGLGIQTLGTTTSPPSYNPLNDFWKFTPEGNQWEELAPYLGEASGGQIAVALGDRAYVGMGTVVSNEGSFSLSSELYEYNSSTDEWTKKADFPFNLRSGAIAFGIDTKIYYGLGSRRIDGPSVGDGFNYLNDFYEYDTETDSWRQLNDLPIQFRRSQASGFAVNDKGYVAAGRRSLLNVETFDDFLTYDPETDSWTQLEDIPGGARYNNNIAVLNDRVMLGLGSVSSFVGGESNKELYFYFPFIPSN